jgi:hypothetical protein
MSEVVTAEQIEAFRTNGFIVIDDLLTDAELDTFEPLVTAAVAYRSAGDERTLEEGGAGGSPVVPAATMPWMKTTCLIWDIPLRVTAIPPRRARSVCAVCAASVSGSQVQHPRLLRRSSWSAIA